MFLGVHSCHLRKVFVGNLLTVKIGWFSFLVSLESSLFSIVLRKTLLRKDYWLSGILFPYFYLLLVYTLVFIAFYFSFLQEFLLVVVFIIP